ncbi:DNA helicase II [Imhoffiella purpurea]|uniref:DNA 3'-5' helicase n=1 Tax=Imhoffiella purpurea TaxID=1249627 RepID=W9VBX2_9GAMM|nr:DNA helicase II [Imhoffiella purpurea]EXJ17088.1 ATP-dependent DNA helicase UvrD/PcrA [Imhoffiella purpurea]
MDVTPLLDSLNEPQRQAVSADSGNLLVLAGAGSGKTRVLVYRIAWLLQVAQVPQWGILAVTFTNKAAREMRGRIEEMLGTPVGGMWVGTFHGLTHRFLRAHWQDAKLPQHFQIMDADDQFRSIKRTLKAMQLDESRWPPRQVQGFINKQKDEGLRPSHLDPAGDFYMEKMVEVYREYESARIQAGLLDFADLLLSSLELLRERPDILHHYQQRFRHILVDEFQDTNAIQYAWLRLLSGNNDNLFAVGDDDQSIYGWRGARVENIQSFQQDYPNTRTVRLEQNYRSTGNILAAANALIANNPTRLGKNLWTDDSDGEPIRRYTAFNEVEESRFVVERIRGFVQNEGYRRDECAILYRTTAQSRLFEESLMQAGIPYRVYGGLRFFERAEIRDALAYLRLVSNPDDDAAFERVVNTPTRGIGERTLEMVRQQSRESRVSLWRAAEDLIRTSALGPRASGAVRRFLDLILEQRRIDAELDLAETVNRLIQATGLPDFYLKSKDGKGQDRIENLEQLVDTVARFEQDLDPEEGDILGAFLAHAALEAGETQADAYEDSVQLMTLHSAKGLEFPIVFLVGLEEGLFPHSLSAEDPERLEEERRLCYVGMTRAMQQLFVTHAENRRLYGREDYPAPSRFLRELPPDLVEEVRAAGVARRHPAPAAKMAGKAGAAAAGGYQLGQHVRHPKFGEGVVLSSEGSGTNARIQVNFREVGAKWLVLAYARLEPAGS